MGMDPKDQRRHATVARRLEALREEETAALTTVEQRLTDLEVKAKLLDTEDVRLRAYVDEVFQDERAYGERLHREVLRHYADADGMLHEFRDRSFLKRLRWLLTGR